MPQRHLKLNILDQSPRNDGETTSAAFQNTIMLAQKAEEWGYHRFWVAEHHNSDRVMGSSPEILISHLLAKTRSIRIGSGGVMLQHYSPYKVAEVFNALATLAPGRVDLGIGSGPGGLPQSTQALQQDFGANRLSIAEKLEQLEGFLQGKLDHSGSFYGLQANPIPPEPPELFLLGTTGSSAELAAQRQLPYAFALFLNNDEKVMARSVGTYRKEYDPQAASRPRVFLALPVIVADSEKLASELAADSKVVRIHLESGRSFTVRSEEVAEEFGRQSNESYTVEVKPGGVIYGSEGTIRSKLEAVGYHYQAEELFIVTGTADFQTRLHSYRLLARAFNSTNSSGM